MSEDQNQQNQGKQKGGGNQAKNGVTLSSNFSSMGNSSLGDTLKGAVTDGIGYIFGAIGTGFAAWMLNKIITKVKPSVKPAPLFPTAEDKAAAGPTANELMGQMHNLRKSDPASAERIVKSIQAAMGMNQQPEQPALPEPVKVEQPKPEPTSGTVTPEQMASAPAPEATKETKADKQGNKAKSK